MKLNIDVLRHALDRAVIAQFQSDGIAMKPAEAAASSPTHLAPPNGTTGYERHDSLVRDAERTLLFVLVIVLLVPPDRICETLLQSLCERGLQTFRP